MVAYEGNENYIFVSYAHKDADRVIPILESLNRAGFRIWYDSGIEVSSEWPAYIQDHLMRSSLILAFISPSSIASVNCRNEINLALKHSKKMLIVYLEPTQLRDGMDLQLNSVQAINAYSYSNTQNLVEGIGRAKIIRCCNVEWNGREQPENTVHVSPVSSRHDDEKVMETEIVYDDAALEAEYLERVKKPHEEDFDPDCVLEVRHLRKTFPIKKTITGKVLKELVAVNDISFKLKAGETLGIVGESGCGKTTAGRAILKLHEPTGGQIIFNGTDITHLKSSQMRKFRKEMQIIFQDPYSSLPPRDTVGGILTEPVHVHGIVPKSQEKEYVLELMDKCGLRDYYYERYPHEFSGGQRQRICIARALSVQPKLVICDEPVSALDVSIQAQIINLLKKLQREMNLAYVFISHDLSVVKFISDKIAVLYLGNMMEYGTKEDIFKNPLHPYTKALFSAIPNPDPTMKMERIKLEGDIPSPANPPKGCKFHTRCPYAKEICKHVIPEYKEHEPGHFAACHLLDEE